MTQGHHPDYETLLGHAANGLMPHTGGHAPAPHGAPPPHGAAPTHALVPVHELHNIVRNAVASQLPGPGPGAAPSHGFHPGAAPHSRHAHDTGYEEERHPRARRRETREGHEEAAHHRHVHPDSAKWRKFPVGFVEAQIAPGAPVEIEVKPQVAFQGYRLAVAPSAARYFNIVDIKVGKDSQLAATGEMPAEAFSALAVGTQMELDRAQPGIVITLIVRNTDTAAHDFGAVLYGLVEED